jgi:hypothetical protein
MMKAILILAAGIAAIAVGTPASAHHLENLDTPYASRGECESTVARFNQDDIDMLLERFPTFFSGQGDVESFLTRAFPCEMNAEDGQWYIQNDLAATLGSDWYQHRNR